MIAAWTLVALWMAVVTVLSVISVPGPDDAFPPGADKWVHAVFYAVLGWLTGRAARRSGAGRRASWTLAIAIAALYGAGIEWAQSAVSRDASLGDWMADVLGAAVGAAVVAAGREKTTAEGDR